MKTEKQADKLILTPENNEKITQVIIYTPKGLEAYNLSLDKLGRLHITIR